MNVSANMTYLGLESGVSANGKAYNVVGLLQGFDAERVYINDEIKKLCDNLSPMTPVTCTLNIRIGEKTFVNLVDIKKSVPDKK